MNIYEYIDRIFVGKKNATIFEIGAYRCDDTGPIMAHVRRAIGKGDIKYFVFEPDPRNHPYIDKSGLMPYVTLFPIAVGAEPGIMKFYQSSGNIDPNAESWTGSGSLKKPKNHLEAFPWCKFDDSVDVVVTTLDSIYSAYSIDRIDFIWCDIQGAEGDMVKGGQNALANTHYLYCEYSDGELYEGQQPLKAWMGNLPGKWEIVEKFAHDVLLVNKDFR